MPREPRRGAREAPPPREPAAAAAERAERGAAAAGAERGPPKPGSAIRISATFVPAGSTPPPWLLPGGVPAFFPPRRGCDVRLYQDAHVGAGELGGEPGRCWEELCLAVLGAQHLVYVAGWSVFTRVRLLRGAMSPEMAAKAAEVRALGGVVVENMSLGDLLKYKSQEGVGCCSSSTARRPRSSSGTRR